MPRIIDVTSGLGVGLQSASNTLATANALKQKEEESRARISNMLAQMAERQEMMKLRAGEAQLAQERLGFERAREERIGQQFEQDMQLARRKADLDEYRIKAGAEAQRGALGLRGQELDFRISQAEKDEAFRAQGFAASREDEEFEREMLLRRADLDERRATLDREKHEASTAQAISAANLRERALDMEERRFEADIEERAAKKRLQALEFKRVQSQLDPEALINNQLETIEELFPQLSVEDQQTLISHVKPELQAQAFEARRARVGKLLGGAAILLKDLKDEEHPFEVEQRGLEALLANADDPEDLDQLTKLVSDFSKEVIDWRTKTDADDATVAEVNKRISASGASWERTYAAKQYLYGAVLQDRLGAPDLFENVEHILHGIPVTDPMGAQNFSRMDPLGMTKMTDLQGDAPAVKGGGDRHAAIRADMDRIQSAWDSATKGGQGLTRDEFLDIAEKTLGSKRIQSMTGNDPLLAAIEEMADTLFPE